MNDENKRGKGGLAFITDEKKDLLAIAADKNKVIAEKKEGIAEKSKTQSIPFRGVSEDIPKFEDD